MSSSDVKLFGATKPTATQLIRRRWVDNFTKKNNYPPTLKQIGKRFRIATTTAWETMQRIQKNTLACPTCGRKQKT